MTQIHFKTFSQIRQKTFSRTHQLAFLLGLQDTYTCHNFYVFFRDYIKYIFDMEEDGNCGFHTIGYFLDQGEQSWTLVLTRLDNEVFNKIDVSIELFYNTFLKVRNSSRIYGLGVYRRGKWIIISDISFQSSSRPLCPRI